MVHHAEAVPVADIKMLQFYIYNENIYIQSNPKTVRGNEEQEMIIRFQRERAAGERHIFCSVHFQPSVNRLPGNLCLITDHRWHRFTLL